jgi:membrane protein implicated in regulation of membrane protease activity
MGLTVGGMAWMAMWVGCSESAYSVLNVAAMWLSPMTVTGWIAFLVLSLICSLLTYRLMRPKRRSYERGR